MYPCRFRCRFSIGDSSCRHQMHHARLTPLSDSLAPMTLFTFTFSPATPSPLLLSLPLLFFLTAAYAQPPALKGACIDVIVKAGSDAQPQHKSLHHAASDSSIESACLLLQQGADVNGRNKCVGRGGVARFTSLFLRLLVLMLNRQNLTALQASILPSEKQMDMVLLLLQNGADVNAKNWCARARPPLCGIDELCFDAGKTQRLCTLLST